MFENFRIESKGKGQNSSDGKEFDLMNKIEIWVHKACTVEKREDKRN